MSDRQTNSQFPDIVCENQEALVKRYPSAAAVSVGESTDFTNAKRTADVIVTGPH
jgi:hypothetical protein